jgi:hypothetical protein
MVTGRHAWQRALTCAALTIVLGVPALAAGPSGHDTEKYGSGPLVVIGHLPEPSDKARIGNIAAVDAQNRRMYYIYPDGSGVVHVVTYDLGPEIPQPLASGVLGSSTQENSTYTPFQAVVDPSRHRLFALGANVEIAGSTAQTFSGNILVYDTQRNRRVATWYLDRQLPGYYPLGMTYSPADDRIYVIGEFSETVLGATWVSESKAAGPVTTVVALDPGTGNAVWVKPLPDCQQALYSAGKGGFIARSRLRDALYVVCTTGGTHTGQPYPGEAGLLRVTIDPKSDSTVDAAGFPTEFFPVSGLYFGGGSKSGIAMFDARTDRLFLQSLAVKTPGAWVFDGRLSGWVGFVAARDWTDEFAGFNEGLGHLYVGQNGGGMPKETDGTIVADGRSLPVQAGAFQPLVTSAYIPTDARSDRLFVLPRDAATQLTPYLVVRDRSRNITPQQPLDYDALTDGVPENRAVFVNYSADVNAYGADVVDVGGLGAPLSLSGQFQIPSVVGSGTRGLMLARIGGLGLRPAGASAAARAVLADLNTTQNWETNKQLKEWPYAPVSCLDSGGGVDPQTADDTGGHAMVECNLAETSAHGETAATDLRTGAISIARATSSADVMRNTKTGAITFVTASTSGIAVDVPGVGTLHIAHVAARLTTAAHGTAGAGAATYHRSVRGVELVATDGESMFGPSACETEIRATGRTEPTVDDTCTGLARAVNRVTQTRVHLGFPMPEVTATPKGAYASVQQAEADYFVEKTGDDQGVVYPQDSTALRPTPAVQVVAYNDLAERMRLVAQFAGVQGDSIFNTTADGSTPPPPPTGVDDPAPSGCADLPPTPRVDGSVPTTTQVDQPVQPVPGPVLAQPTTGLAGWLFVHRSLRDALLVAGILGIAVAAGLLAFRRHQLLTAMTVPTGGPPR